MKLEARVGIGPHSGLFSPKLTDHYSNPAFCLQTLYLPVNEHVQHDTLSSYMVSMPRKIHAVNPLLARTPRVPIHYSFTGSFTGSGIRDLGGVLKGCYA